MSMRHEFVYIACAIRSERWTSLASAASWLAIRRIIQFTKVKCCTHPETAMNTSIGHNTWLTMSGLWTQPFLIETLCRKHQHQHLCSTWLVQDSRKLVRAELVGYNLRPLR